MMILATLLLTIFHPGRFIGERWKESGWGVGKPSVTLDLDKCQYEIEDGSPHPRPEDVFNRPWPMQEMDLVHK